MDTSISRISDFRAPPPYPQLAAFEEKPAPGWSPEQLDKLDELVRAARAVPHIPRLDRDYLRDFKMEERIYIALASSRQELISDLGMTIPEAIDRLGWVDASAMVARWSKRKG